MHKYQPRVRLVLKRDSKSFIGDVEHHHKTFVFPETVFIAVTAYQNQLVSESLILSLKKYFCFVALFSQSKFIGDHCKRFNAYLSQVSVEYSSRGQLGL